jgi:hypothetical protein
MPASRGAWLVPILLLAGCFPRARSHPEPLAFSPAFVNVAPGMGLHFKTNLAERRPRDILATNGSGCAFLDYDGDGRLDILLVGNPHCALFHNEGDHFVDVTSAAGLGAPGHWIGVGVGDWDNDGRPDVCLSGFGCGALLHNEGGRFQNVTPASGIQFPHWGQSPAFGDVDNDGRLDLYVGAYARFGPRDPRYCNRGRLPALCGPELYQPELGRLYHNDGGGRFHDVTVASGLSAAHGRSWGAMFQDFDGDGRQDLYIANDMVACDLFHNLGGGRFRNVGLSSGTAYDGAGNRIGGMSVDWCDYDNDGRPDLMATAFSAQSTLLLHQKADHNFEDVSHETGISGPTTPLVGFGGRFIDYDNDGWPDLLLSNGHVMDNAEQIFSAQTYRQPLLLLRNQGGYFTDVSRDLLRGIPPIAARGATFGDFDNDGRTDALVMDIEGEPLLLHNVSPPGRWLGIRLVGRRSNRDGLGARIEVQAGALTRRFECQTSGSLLSAQDPRTLIGLGTADVEEVRIVWPSGTRSRIERPQPGRYLTVTEGE